MLLFFFLSFSSDQDHGRLSRLIAREKILGHIPLCWEELGMGDRGLTLNREEASRYLKGEGEKLPPERQALYEVLFDYHPELKLSVFSPQELLERLQQSENIPKVQVFGGVDVGQGHFFPCVLNLDTALGGPRLELATEPMDVVRTARWLLDKQVATVCIDGPPRPNNGELAMLLPQDTTCNTARRVAEFQLGIGGCYGTPAMRPVPGAANAWMASAMDLFDCLSRCMDCGIDLGDRVGQLIETHPTYAFKALIGNRTWLEHGLTRYRPDPLGNLRPKSTRAGRDQRISLLEQALARLNVPVTDEIRDCWKARVDWIDATICALMAAWRQLKGPETIPVGDDCEGSIYLHFPEDAYTLPPVAIEAARPAVAREAGEPDGANAVIFRLGGNGPGGMNQQDTVDIVVLAAAEGKVWIPIDSRAQFNLAQNLEAVGGNLYLAFGDRLVLHVVVEDCQRDMQQKIPYPGEENPWPVTESYGWVLAVEAHEVDIANFEVRHGNAWGPGFPNQSTLHWGRVNAG
jgi:hypothetical protein